MIHYAKYIIIIIALLGCREKEGSIAKALVQRQEAEIELIQETLQAYNSALYQEKIAVAIPYLSSGHRKQFDIYLSKAKQLNELNLYEEAIPDLSVLLRLLRAFSNDEFATLTNDDMYYGYLIEGMPVYNKMNTIKLVNPIKAIGYQLLNEKDSIPVNFEKDDGIWKINTWPDEEHKWIREKNLLQEYSRSKKEYVDGMYDMIVGNKNHKLKFH